MRYLAVITLALLVLTGCQPSFKPDLKAGWHEFLKKDYATGLMHFRPLAEQGDPWAQSSLAGAYKYGKGVTQDGKEAARWYRKAAEQGHAPAQHQLGMMYRDAVIAGGVTRDYKEALHWLRKAAGQGNAVAVQQVDRLEEQLRAEGNWPP